MAEAAGRRGTAGGYAVSDDTGAPPPSQIQTIGVLHLVGGVFNLFATAVWALYGVAVGIGTFGFGCVMCCVPFLLLPVAILELMSAVKHLSKDHSGLKEPKMVAFAEIACILGCNMIPTIMGVVTLVLLNDPKVQAYYQSKQLTG